MPMLARRRPRLNQAVKRRHRCTANSRRLPGGRATWPVCLPLLHRLALLDWLASPSCTLAARTKLPPEMASEPSEGAAGAAKPAARRKRGREVVPSSEGVLAPQRVLTGGRWHHGTFYPLCQRRACKQAPVRQGRSGGGTGWGTRRCRRQPRGIPRGVAGELRRVPPQVSGAASVH